MDEHVYICPSCRGPAAGPGEVCPACGYVEEHPEDSGPSCKKAVQPRDGRMKFRLMCAAGVLMMTLGLALLLFTPRPAPVELSAAPPETVDPAISESLSPESAAGPGTAKEDELIVPGCDEAQEELPENKGDSGSDAVPSVKPIASPVLTDRTEP